MLYARIGAASCSRK